MRGPVSPRRSDCAEVLKSPEGAEFKALIDATADKCPTLPCAPSPCESGGACSVVTVFAGSSLPNRRHGIMHSAVRAPFF
jgi:hypothetical protein